MAQKRIARRSGEFDLIARFFKPLAADAAARGLDDDAAVFDPPPGRSLVVTTDMLSAGVHFLPRADPADIAWKALAVNLSDLAAMGAAPVGYTLALALGDDADDAWIAAFASGLGAAQAAFGVALLGGDTTATPGPTTVSVTAIGTVEAGCAVPRSGARPRDIVCVTGTIGDGALGLRTAQGETLGLSHADAAYLSARYTRPTPRLGVVDGVAGVHACADVSDGLVADAGHIADASGVAVVIEAAAVPLSDAARAAVAADPTLLETVLTGGDDYELVCAVAPDMMIEGLIPVGRAEAGAGVTVVDADGIPMPLGRAGWTHR
jgi:thiamine-monophosphate kinase